MVTPPIRPFPFPRLRPPLVAPSCLRTRSASASAALASPQPSLRLLRPRQARPKRMVCPTAARRRWFHRNSREFMTVRAMSQSLRRLWCALQPRSRLPLRAAQVARAARVCWTRRLQTVCSGLRPERGRSQVERAMVGLSTTRSSVSGCSRELQLRAAVAGRKSPRSLR